MGDVSRKASRRQDIIDAATELVRERGVAGTSIADIVEASGTSAGAIYHHFPNKNALLLDIVRTAVYAPQQVMKAMRVHPLSPAEFTVAACRGLAVDLDRARLMLAFGAAAATDDELGHLLREEFASLRDDVVELFGLWAKDNGVDPAQAYGYTQLSMGLIQGCAIQLLLVGGFDEDAYCQQILDILTVS